MRGGARALGSPFITGSFGVLLLFVGFNYWSVSGQNRDLRQMIAEMQVKLKVSSDAVEKLESDFSDCKDKLEDTKKSFNMYKDKSEDDKRTLRGDVKKHIGNIDGLVYQKNELEKQIDEFKEQIRSLTGNKDLEMKKLMEDVDNLKTQLDQERDNSANLKSQLAEVLVESPGLPGGRLVGGNKELGPGQLPDLDPNAVSVKKKDTLGGQGLEVLPAEVDNDRQLILPNQNSSSRGISSTSSISPKNDPQVVDDLKANNSRDNEAQRINDLNLNVLDEEEDKLSAELKEADPGSREQIEDEQLDVPLQQGKNLDQAEADNHRAEQENGDRGNQEIDNDDQDPAGDLGEDGAQGVLGGGEEANHGGGGGELEEEDEQLGLDGNEDTADDEDDPEVIEHGEVKLEEKKKANNKDGDYELDNDSAGGVHGEHVL